MVPQLEINYNKILIDYNKILINYDKILINHDKILPVYGTRKGIFFVIRSYNFDTELIMCLENTIRC